MQDGGSPESEHDVQSHLFAWAERQSCSRPALDMLFAIPNGQYRPGQRPEPGIQSGVPDVCLPVPRPPYQALYLELKTEGGRLRDEQATWLQELRGYGYAGRVGYGFEYAKELILLYLTDDLPEPPPLT